MTAKEQLDAYTMKHPENWQLYPYLPVLRRIGNRFDQLELGVLWIGENPTGSDKCVIRLTNLYNIPSTVSEYGELEKFEYSSPQEAVEDGWCVD